MVPPSSMCSRSSWVPNPASTAQAAPRVRIARTSRALSTNFLYPFPTPAGIVSKRRSMILERWGRRSRDSIFELRRRTPQLMSYPTPPGDTTPPSSGSKAATPPMANPYPQWMSGIPMERPTMPGSWATLATWVTASSPLISLMRFSSAKMSPSTLIFPSRGISHRYGSNLTNSTRTSPGSSPLRQTSKITLPSHSSPSISTTRPWRVTPLISRTRGPESKHPWI